MGYFWCEDGGGELWNGGGGRGEYGEFFSKTLAATAPGRTYYARGGFAYGILYNNKNLTCVYHTSPPWKKENFTEVEFSLQLLSLLRLIGNSPRIYKQLTQS